MSLCHKAAALAAVLALIGCESTKDTALSVQLVPEDNALDFGEVWEQSDFRWQFKVHNPGSRAVEVIGVRTACSCVDVSPRTFTVMPGEVQLIDAVLDLRSSAGRMKSESDGPPISQFSVSLAPLFRDSKTTPENVLFITGRVRHSLGEIPRLVDFGDVSHDSATSPVVTLPITCPSGISLVDARCDEAWGTPMLSHDEMGKPRIDIQLNRRALGRFSFPLHVLAETNDGRPLPPVDVSGTGNVVGDVEVFPPATAFGLLHPGETIENTIFIPSRSGRPLQIETISAPGDGIDVLPSPHARSDGSFAYRVKVNAAQVPGNHSATIDFRVASPDREPATVRFRLAYVVSADGH